MPFPFDPDPASAGDGATADAAAVLLVPLFRPPRVVPGPAWFVADGVTGTGAWPYGRTEDGKVAQSPRSPGYRRAGRAPAQAEASSASCATSRRPAHRGDARVSISRSDAATDPTT